MSCIASDDFKEVSNSTVRFKYERIENKALITGHGTAFGIDLSNWGLKGKNYLFSAAHNVLDDQDKVYEDLWVEINGDWLKCTVIKYDKSLDICILKVKAELNVLQLDEDDISPKDKLVIAGSVMGNPVKLFFGTLQKKFRKGSIHSCAKIEFNQGDSGSPVVNIKTAKVIGMMTAGIPKKGGLDLEHGLYVPIIAIKDFLQRLNEKDEEDI
jgi:S1-C subfamily serine protease